MRVIDYLSLTRDSRNLHAVHLQKFKKGAINNTNFCTVNRFDH